MVASQIAICPICQKRTYIRIQDGAYLQEYPIRYNCMHCRAEIMGSFNISLSGNKGLQLTNAAIEDVKVDTNTNKIVNAEYILHISGELPCAKISEFNGELITTSPFINTSVQVDMIQLIERLSEFNRKMDEWKSWKSIAFQLFSEGSLDYVPTALKHHMGEYTYNCDNELKTLHCLQEAVHEEMKYIFFPDNQNDVRIKVISQLSTIDRNELHLLVNEIGGVDTIIREYRKIIDIIISFENIYPNILPAETYMKYTLPDTSLGISTCSFQDVKSYYQDSYESLLSILYIPVCLDNILIRSHYYTFEGTVSSFINSSTYRIKHGSDYEKYMEMDKGKKAELYNQAEPIQSIICLSANKDLRNAIGHNNFKYDGITQEITIHDHKNNSNTKYSISLIDVAMDCIRLARSAVIIGDIFLFILRQEYQSQFIQSALHPRFYDHTERNDKCPCGSGKKYKNCCQNEIKKMEKTDAQ